MKGKHALLFKGLQRRESGSLARLPPYMGLETEDDTSVVPAAVPWCSGLYMAERLNEIVSRRFWHQKANLDPRAPSAKNEKEEEKNYV